LRTLSDTILGDLERGTSYENSRFSVPLFHTVMHYACKPAIILHRIGFYPTTGGLEIFSFTPETAKLAQTCLLNPNTAKLCDIWQLNFDPGIQRCRFLVTRQNEVLIISRICILAAGVS